jgi:hypothetical protein
MMASGGLGQSGGGQPDDGSCPPGRRLQQEALVAQLGSLPAQGLHLLCDRYNQDALRRQGGQESIDRQLKERALAHQL